LVMGGEQTISERPTRKSMVGSGFRVNPTP